MQSSGEVGETQCGERGGKGTEKEGGNPSPRGAQVPHAAILTSLHTGDTSRLATVSFLSGHPHPFPGDPTVQKPGQVQSKQIHTRLCACSPRSKPGPPGRCPPPRHRTAQAAALGVRKGLRTQPGSVLRPGL